MTRHWLDAWDGEYVEIDIDLDDEECGLHTDRGLCTLEAGHFGGCLHVDVHCATCGRTLDEADRVEYRRGRFAPRPTCSECFLDAKLSGWRNAPVEAPEIGDDQPTREISLDAPTPPYPRNVSSLVLRASQSRRQS